MTATADAPAANREMAASPGAITAEGGSSGAGENRGAADPKDSDDRTPEEKKKDKAKLEAEEREAGDLSGLLKRLTDADERRARNAESQAQTKAFESFVGYRSAPQVGSQHFYYGADVTATAGSAKRGDPVTGEELYQVRQRFVAPGGYPELHRIIEQNSVLILRDRVGLGRSWAALHLLDNVCDGRIRRMPIRPSSGWPAAEDIDDDTGYLWDPIPAEQMQRFDVHDIESFAHRLHARSARAVIIAPPNGRLPPGLVRFVGTLTDRPSTLAVVERCLTHSLSGEYSAAVARTLADGRVVTALADMISDECSTAEVADFARSLVSTITGVSDLDSVCASASQSEERLAAWFIDLAPDLRSFAVALAALPGASLPIVSGASWLVDRRIQRAEKPDKFPAVQIFTRPTPDLLKATYARREQAHARWSYGAVPADTVWPTLAGYSKRLLTLLWNTYPQMHPILTGWLKELASTEAPEIRVPASTAVGLLAELDFPHIYLEMLTTWATSYTREDRHAAVAALRIPVLNPQLTDVVWAVLLAWSKSDVSDQLQMTAAAALGAPVGATDHSRALEILGAQATTDRYRLIQAICQAVTDLFGATPSNAAAQVIVTLTQWSQDSNGQRRNTALAAFLQIALDLNWTRSDDEQWPALLCVSDGNAGQRDAVAALWRLALHRPVFGVAAADAFRRCVLMADDAPTMREALIDLTITIARDPRDASTLRYYLDIWSRNKNETTETARILIDCLERTR